MEKIYRLILILIILITWAFAGPSLHAQTISTDAEWPCFRRDLFNTGISYLKGPLTQLEEKWTYSLGGGIGSARMKDVDNDGFDEIFVMNTGKIIAYEQDGSLMWNSPIIGVNFIIDILDIDNDGDYEIACGSSEPPTMFLITAQTGQVAWKHYFPPPSGTVLIGATQIADLDNSKDGKLELFCWTCTGGATGYAFSFKNGAENGEIIWDAYAQITESYWPQVMVADMNCDSIPEVVIGTYGHIYAWQGDNGTSIVDFEFKTGESYGRNYGIIKIKNVDDDPYPELTVLAFSLNEHVTQIDNEGPAGNMVKLSIAWDHWFEYSYPEDHKSLRVSPNGVNDVDNDGRQEVVYAVFNDKGDNQWHLLIYDAQDGTLEYDLPGYHLIDVVDIDLDGQQEVFLSQESSSVTTLGNLHILHGTNDSYAIVYSGSAMAALLDWSQKLPPDVNSTSGMNGLFLRDIDMDGTPNLFSGSGNRFYAYKFENDDLVKVWNSYPTSYAASLLDAGKTGTDSFRTPFISCIDGHSFLIDATGDIKADISIGSYYAMPIAADLGNDGTIEILVQNAIGFMNVLNAENATPDVEPVIAWRQPGAGKSAKWGRNSTAYVDDYDGDDKKEVFISQGNDLLIYDYKGRKKRDYTFESYPYEWVTGYFNDDSTKDLFVAFNALGGHTNIIHIYDGNGNKAPLWTKDYGPYSGYVVIYDFTKDGIDDIVLREHYDLVTLDGKDGTRYGFCPGAYYHTPILMDVDFSGSYEVINGGGYIEVSVNKLYSSGRNISQIWEQPTGYLDCYARMPGTADVDNDGHVEMGVSSTNGTFACFDAYNGTIEWTYDLGTTASDIICMDADNDDRLEFVFGGLDGYLYIMNGETDVTNRIEAQFDLNAQVGSPIAADLDADGVAELLVTTYD
ncbi:VCBS repeat-containing protein, partial [candidate division KSB1 bacterium]|nr:VCBS repeat-containing protein [candidate division KSB1 bacterium]